MVLFGVSRQPLMKELGLCASWSISCFCISYLFAYCMQVGFFLSSSEGLREDEWGCQLAEATQYRTGATDLWPRSWLDCL